MTDNPFAPPSDDTDRGSIPAPARIPKTRLELAGQASVCGCLGGALVGTFGFLLAVAAIELLLTPPFKSPPNYGQFFIVVIGVGFYASLFGVCLGVVPYVTWLGYLPLHFLGLWLIWMIDKQFFLEVEWTEAPMVAMFCVFLLPTPVAVCVGGWAGRYARIPGSGTQGATLK